MPTVDVRILDHPVHAVAEESFPAPAGAECVFLGRTRCEVHPDHGELQRLSYEAYVPLARRVLDDLAREALKRFDCYTVRIHHAIGDVPLGEASVLIQVVCGHRHEAFTACRFLIDRLKESAPIWKRERWADGTTWSKGTQVRTEEQP